MVSVVSCEGRFCWQSRWCVRERALEVQQRGPFSDVRRSQNLHLRARDIGWITREKEIIIRSAQVMDLRSICRPKR